MRGARIGRRAGRLVAKVQVSKVARNSTGSIDCSICVPRQDSNLRSRLRRGLLCVALTSGNMLAEILSGRV